MNSRITILMFTLLPMSVVGISCSPSNSGKIAPDTPLATAEHGKPHDGNGNANPNVQKPTDDPKSELQTGAPSKSFAVWFAEGQASLDELDNEAALTAFTKAIELDASSAGAYNSRGVAYLRMSKLAPALRDFNKAIELEPNTAKFYGNRAFVQSDKEEYARAVADLDKAIQLEPKSSEWYRERGKIYVFMEDTRLAENDFDTAKRLDGESLTTPREQTSIQHPKQHESDTKRWEFDTPKDLDELTHWPTNKLEARDGRLIVSGKQEWLSITFREQITLPIKLRFKGIIQDGLFVVFPATTRAGIEFPALNANDAKRERQLVCRLSEDRNRTAKIALAGFGGLPDQVFATSPQTLADGKDHIVELILTTDQMTLRIDDGVVLQTKIPPGPPCDVGQLRFGKFVPRSDQMSFDWFEITGIRTPRMAQPVQFANNDPPKAQVDPLVLAEKRKKADARVAELDKERQAQLNELQKRAGAIGPRLKAPKMKPDVRRSLESELLTVKDKIASIQERAEPERRAAVHSILEGDSPYTKIDGRLLTKEEKHKWDELSGIHGSPRLAADNYVQSMLDAGSLREAAFVEERNDMITGCINIGQVIDWPSRIRSVHYEIKYVSKGGLVNERLAYVVVFKAKDGLWYVSSDTQLDRNGIHFSKN